ncbi:MAG: hypothetical protein OXF60_06500 [Gammaproteobacteria bacterium]|nr:hypothetical protein [Gammaproteobacteria bacterium]
MKYVLLTIHIGLFALLAACGSSNNATYFETLQNSLDDARTQNVDRIVSEMSKASTNAPTFGSVTQSTDQGATARVSFDGMSTSVVVTKSDDKTVEFGGSAVDSDQKNVQYTVIDGPPAFWTKGHSMTSAERSGQRIQFTTAETSWDENNPRSYVTLGVWEEFKHENGQYHAESFGAYVDGPELRDNFSWRSQSGTATYKGTTIGHYAYHVPSNPENDQFGTFQAALNLQLNLDRQTITGQAGLDGGVEVFRSDGRSEMLPIGVMLEETKIENNGSFSSNEFKIVSNQIVLSHSSGYWGGKLSNLVNDDNKPRMAGGTAAGKWTDIFGGEGSLNSAWIAALDES